MGTHGTVTGLLRGYARNDGGGVHRTVLLAETVAALGVRAGGLYIDGTLGGGGHAEAILSAGADVRVLGLDRDASALARAGERLARFGDRLVCAHVNFAAMGAVAVSMGFGSVDGIVLDLGVSSFQLDEADRGFSFRQDGPLDMRMDVSQGVTAAEYLASFGDDWRSLAKVISEYGEEPLAGKVARAIAGKSFSSTLELAGAVSKAVGGKHSARHPATRTFQAIRMAVNGELQAVGQGIEAALSLLVLGGRLAVISFHSVEDRVVKQALAGHVGKWVSLQQGGEAWQGRLPVARWVSKKPVAPSEAEVDANPRARSAKLRVVERIETNGEARR